MRLISIFESGQLVCSSISNLNNARITDISQVFDSYNSVRKIFSYMSSIH